MKKISLLLALIMLLSVVASGCVKVKVKKKGTNTSADTQQTEENERDAKYKDAVPADLRYDGYKFTMAFPNPADHGMDLEIIEDGSVTSKIDVSIYNRNMQIEDRFGITFDGICVGNSDTESTFLAEAVMSEEDAVDLAFITFSFSGIPWITSGHAMPWNDVEYIDTDRAYWNKSMVDNLSVMGKNFLIQGDINWMSMRSTQVVFFNYNVLNDNKIENPYQLVWDGTWTFDKLLSLVKDVGKDLNSDGFYDENDQYGIAMCYYGAVYEIGIAANYLTVLSEDDGFRVNVDTDKFSDICDFAMKLIYDDGNTYIEKYDYIEESIGTKIFFDDRALFAMTGLGTGDYFRNENSDYGIIPWPKYNESQAKYCTTNDQWGLSLSIPTSATNPSRTGAITEALCALSGKLVYPTYYEEVLSVRNTRDEESKEMLDLIFSNVIHDPGISFGINEVYIPLYKLVADKSNDISAWSAKYSKKVQGQFDKLTNYVANNY